MRHLHQPMHWSEQQMSLADAKAEHQKAPGDGGRDERESDADTLARLTHLPGLVWVGVLLAITGGCLVLGARWLWLPT